MLKIYSDNMDSLLYGAPEAQNLSKGLEALGIYAQDSLTGIPQAPDQVEALYENIPEIRVRTLEALAIGDLVNIYFQDQEVVARKASSLSLETYANGIAKEAKLAGELILIGVKTSYVPLANSTGSIWLSATSGQISHSIKDSNSAKIVQCVGFADATGIYFNFTSPAKV